MDKRKRRILVVEDEAELAEMLGFRLEKEGFEVLKAGDGHEALLKARGEKPDLMLLDLLIPKFDGLKVCRMLKYDRRFKHIPVIILTALGEENDRERGLSMGAEAYMTKPFKWEELLGKINELLNTKK